jgi:hypothetical protein
MGYGHLRAAKSLADVLGTPIERADQPPFVSRPSEQRLWSAVRAAHEGLSRLSRLPFGVGDRMRRTLDAITAIEDLHVTANHHAPDASTHLTAGLISRGLGRGLVEILRRHHGPLLTTYYLPALIADAAGLDDVFCVVTDADVHRVWVAHEPDRSRIRYFAPSRRVVKRLEAYGVARERIEYTGFPLPHELVGGEDLVEARAHLTRRLVRLDPHRLFLDAQRAEIERMIGTLPREHAGEPPLLTYAVGGAGAQAHLVDAFLPSIASLVLRGKLRVALVAGTRREVAETFMNAIDRAGLRAQVDRSVEVLLEDAFDAYYGAFNRLLARTDILWSKPSEVSFYGALGLPIVIAPPLGSHERYNRRWLREQGVGLKQRSPRVAAGWLTEWIEDGTLASAAWSGFARMPKTGTYAIARAVRPGRADTGREPHADPCTRTPLSPRHTARA